MDSQLTIALEGKITPNTSLNHMHFVLYQSLIEYEKMLWEVQETQLSDMLK